MDVISKLHKNLQNISMFNTTLVLFYFSDVPAVNGDFSSDYVTFSSRHDAISVVGVLRAIAGRPKKKWCFDRIHSFA